MIGAVGSVGRLGLVARRGRLLLYPAYVQNYLDRVTAADVAAGNTQGLDLVVTDAFNTCLQAMVGDGSLGVSGATPEVQVLSQSASLIKASCLMMGARTLPGALVPLAADMPAPTNFNFVAGDYNRRTGLGDPANVSKYLNSNYLGSATPQNNSHLCVYVSTARTAAGVYAGVESTVRYTLYGNTASISFGMKQASIDASGVALSTTGLIGASRSGSNLYAWQAGGASGTFSTPSLAGALENVFIFCRNAPNPTNHINARMPFYSIGENLNLNILSTRVTALSTAIQAAIAP